MKLKSITNIEQTGIVQALTIGIFRFQIIGWEFEDDSYLSLCSINDNINSSLVKIRDYVNDILET
jgi:hypothetical protein